MRCRQHCYVYRRDAKALIAKPASILSHAKLLFSERGLQKKDSRGAVGPGRMNSGYVPEDGLSSLWIPWERSQTRPMRMARGATPTENVAQVNKQLRGYQLGAHVPTRRHRDPTTPRWIRRRASTCTTRFAPTIRNANLSRSRCWPCRQVPKLVSVSAQNASDGTYPFAMSKDSANES